MIKFIQDLFRFRLFYYLITKQKIYSKGINKVKIPMNIKDYNLLLESILTKNTFNQFDLIKNIHTTTVSNFISDNEFLIPDIDKEFKLLIKNYWKLKKRLKKETEYFNKKVLSQYIENIQNILNTIQ